ncbi:MAG: hypothetical protein DRQ62_06800 [Gammaproteobacteria bacterium]|nr:MAG: hypothetical protein DRQ62_06800 [Gammaproteobacteria bacterium]
MNIIFTDYIKYRATLRGFSLHKIENILRYSQEKYFDVETQRKIIAGKHDEHLVIIPYEIEKESLIPVTIHITTRQQIKFRLKTGRFIHE